MDHNERMADFAGVIKLARTGNPMAIQFLRDVIRGCADDDVPVEHLIEIARLLLDWRRGHGKLEAEAN